MNESKKNKAGSESMAAEAAALLKSQAEQREARVKIEADRVATETTRAAESKPATDNTVTVVLNAPGNAQADKPVEQTDGDRAALALKAQMDASDAKLAAILSNANSAKQVASTGTTSKSGKPSEALETLRDATGMSDEQLKVMGEKWLKSKGSFLKVLTASLNATCGTDLHPTTVWCGFRALGFRKSKPGAKATVTLTPIMVNKPAIDPMIAGLTAAAQTA